MLPEDSQQKMCQSCENNEVVSVLVLHYQFEY